MGFFDRFKKGKNTTEQIKPAAMPRQTQPYEFQTFAGEGGTFFEMIDNTHEVGKYYDTTRIFIPDTSTIVGGHALKECFVSWYGQDDCVMLDKNGEEFGKRTEYSCVLAGIDMNALQNDYSYQVALMRDLFKETRVIEYLKRGEQDSPEMPCGKYIGYINNQRKKAFDPSIGRAAHNTPEMQQRRTMLKAKAEQERLNSIARRKEEIAKLQGEISDLEGNSR